VTGLHYRHVDVFAARAYSGNSLAVFVDPPVRDPAALLTISQELRHFESVFLWPTDDPRRWATRVFDLFEELPFAGHPVLGAAAVLHERTGTSDTLEWQIALPGRTVGVTTRPAGNGRWSASLEQGAAEFGDEWDSGSAVAEQVAAAYALDPRMLRRDLPLRVISTGLRYLVIPVSAEGLARARIARDLTKLLAGLGAQFAVLLDPDRPEARHWNNDGVIEDVATGSAAGCVAAYLRRQSIIADGTAVTLHQGRFTGRPSELSIQASGLGAAIGDVRVGGMISAVGAGRLDTLP
jgi:PhzF family phenazine biosynthesis protein